MGNNLKSLRQSVYQANMELNQSGLVLHTFGNVSGVDRDAGIMLIKPSGVAYEELGPQNMVPVDLKTGKVVEGKFKPSSDTATHLELYRAFRCGGVVHTHSAYATALAQSNLPIRCMGTTHADYFHGDIPITRPMTRKEVEAKDEYEKNTGLVIVETFKDKDPMAIPAVLVPNHGPFVWGKNPHDAVYLAVVAEFLAKMDCVSRSVRPEAPLPPTFLVDKHYLRKHGKDAYYGQ